MKSSFRDLIYKIAMTALLVFVLPVYILVRLARDVLSIPKKAAVRITPIINTAPHDDEGRFADDGGPPSSSPTLKV